MLMSLTLSHALKTLNSIYTTYFFIFYINLLLIITSELLPYDVRQYFQPFSQTSQKLLYIQIMLKFRYQFSEGPEMLLLVSCSSMNQILWLPAEVTSHLEELWIGIQQYLYIQGDTICISILVCKQYLYVGVIYI